MAETDPNVALQPDEELDDKDSAFGDDATSSTASISSAILDYRKENGRTYHAFRDGKYNYPNDEAENERLDLQHHIWSLTLDGKLGISPPNEKDANPARVLDAGTGTGIWAVDFADEHTDSRILGIDLSPIQPSFVPPNVEFQIDDIEDDWTFSHPFDYIHSRMMNASISDWPVYLKKCFENLNSGGYIELQEFGLVLSDDDTLKPEHSLYKACVLLDEGAAKLKHPYVNIFKLKGMLEDAGFVDIVETRFKWPNNTWPKDKKFKELGKWNNLNITSGFHAFLIAVLTRALGWTQEEVEILTANAKKDVNDRSIHSYWPIIVLYGKKP